MKISSAKAFTGLRVSIGVLFLILAEYKVVGDQFTHGGFQYWINQFVQNGSYPFMIPVLQNFVLPHARALALLVDYGSWRSGFRCCSGPWCELPAFADSST